MSTPEFAGGSRGGSVAVEERKPDRFGRAAAALTGIAVGLGVNAVSDSFPGAIPTAIVAAVGSVIALAGRIRRLPPRAPLRGLIGRTGLVLAAVLAASSLLVPPSATGWVVLLAAGIALIGCVSVQETDRAVRQLFSSALIGLGVSFLGPLISGSAQTSTNARFLAIGVGVSLLYYGVALLFNATRNVGIAQAGLGLVVVVSSVILLFEGRGVVEFAILAFGVSMIGYGFAAIVESGLFFLLGLSAGGLAFVGGGIYYVVRGEWLFGISIAVAGTSLVLLIVIIFVDALWLWGATLVLGGLGLAGLGVNYMLDQAWLFGAATFVASIGLTIYGSIDFFRSTELRERWDRLLRDPTCPE